MPRLFLFLHKYIAFFSTFSKSIDERNTVSRGGIIEKCIKGGREELKETESGSHFHNHLSFLFHVQPTPFTSLSIIHGY